MGEQQLNDSNKVVEEKQKENILVKENIQKTEVMLQESSHLSIQHKTELEDLEKQLDSKTTHLAQSESELKKAKQVLQLQLEEIERITNLQKQKDKETDDLKEKLKDIE